jgi:hypothetical protein
VRLRAPAIRCRGDEKSFAARLICNVSRKLRSGLTCWPLRRVQSEPSRAGETTVDTRREVATPAVEIVRSRWRAVCQRRQRGRLLTGRKHQWHPTLFLARLEFSLAICAPPRSSMGLRWWFNMGYDTSAEAFHACLGRRLSFDFSKPGLGC